MASIVDICNKSLSHIGIYNAISSLTQATKEARECKLHFETIRDGVLEDHNWAFARKRKVLALCTEVYSGWDFAYQVPTDCVAPRLIYDENNKSIDGVEGAMFPPIKFEVVTNDGLSRNIILTNKEDAELVYTARVIDPNVYSPSFIIALSLRLAADLAFPLKGKLDLAQTMLSKYQLQISAAKLNDSNKGYDTPKNVNTLLASRS